MATLQSVAFRRLPLALRLYAQAYPGNRVQVLERSGALVTEAVRQNQADFGIHILQDTQSDLVEEVLMRDPFVLVCSRDHSAGCGRHGAMVGSAGHRPDHAGRRQREPADRGSAT